MGERSCGLETRNTRYRRVRSDIEEDLAADKRARPSVIQAHLERFGAEKRPSPMINSAPLVL